jgi:hypothetical protein
MSKYPSISKGSRGAGLLLVTSMMICLIMTAGCKQTSGKPATAPDTGSPTEPTAQAVDHDATAAAEEMKALEEQKAQTETAVIEMTQAVIASITAEYEATQADLAGRRATAAVKATTTEQARLDAAATEQAKATSTPTSTPLPTRTNTPAAGAAAPPTTGRIVRNPGEQAPGDHYVNVHNKTGGNVTIIMDSEDFKYQFNVPAGNYKIYLRPGFYFYTIYLCGGQTSGSHQFNANWTWTLSCK